MRCVICMCVLCAVCARQGHAAALSKGCNFNFLFIQCVCMCGMGGSNCCARLRRAFNLILIIVGRSAANGHTD